MRKLIAIILCAVMTLSVAVVGVSAAEPLPVANAEDFAKMIAEGSYYLTADIALTDSYAEFKGTLDGKNHTITVSGNPVFTKLTSATVSNLTVAGSVEGSKAHIGALCGTGANLTLTKVTNKATVSQLGDGKYAGGLVGILNTTSGAAADNKIPSIFTDCVNDGAVSGSKGKNRIGGIVGNSVKYSDAKYVRCINNGNISALTGISGTHYIAGIAGSAFGATFIDCVNNGKISSVGGTANMGGILATMSPSPQGGDQSVTITGCVNNGTLEASNGQCGGIVGRVSSPKATKTENGSEVIDPPKCVTQILTLKNCTNNGPVTSGGSYAGGLVGYLFGISPTTASENGKNYPYSSYAVITDCVNTAAITGTGDTTFVSQFMAYSNVNENTIKNCYGSGSVTAKDDKHAVIIGLSSADATKYIIEGNYVTDSTKYFSYADPASDGTASPNEIPMSADLAAKVTIASADEINAKIAAMNETAPADPGTTPVVTGDTAVIVMIVCAVSLLGMGIALKARKA